MERFVLRTDGFVQSTPAIRAGRLDQAGNFQGHEAEFELCNLGGWQHPGRNSELGGRPLPGFTLEESPVVSGTRSTPRSNGRELWGKRIEIRSTGWRTCRFVYVLSCATPTCIRSISNDAGGSGLPAGSWFMADDEVLSLQRFRRRRFLRTSIAAGLAGAGLNASTGSAEGGRASARVPDWVEEARRQIPATRHLRYFQTGGIGVCPQGTIDHVKALLDSQNRGPADRGFPRPWRPPKAGAGL